MSISPAPGPDASAVQEQARCIVNDSTFIRRHLGDCHAHFAPHSALKEPLGEG